MGDSSTGAHSIPTTAFALNDEEDVNITILGWTHNGGSKYYGAVDENGRMYYFMSIDTMSASYGKALTSLDGNLNDSWEQISESLHDLSYLPLCNPESDDPDPKPVANFNLLKQLVNANNSIWVNN